MIFKNTQVAWRNKMAFCVNCGNSLSDGEKFCRNCGKEVEGVKREEENPYAPPQQSVPEFGTRKNPW
jgi:predicted amidophosphoribosyltransferase